MKEKYDSEEFYCPKLGHHLTFKYCRSENFNLPCARIPICCSEKIPVPEYLTANYSKEVIQRIFKAKESKITSILGLVQQANRLSNTGN